MFTVDVMLLEFCLLAFQTPLEPPYWIALISPFYPALPLFQIVVEGNRVNVAGFGTFEPRQRSARKGRNPKTGEEIAISASTGCGFSAAKQLKDRLNGKE